jgi:hypothetical protein
MNPVYVALGALGVLAVVVCIVAIAIVVGFQRLDKRRNESWDDYRERKTEEYQWGPKK